MRRCALLLAAAAVVTISAGCGGSGHPPTFQGANGWHVLVEPGQIVSAANVPFAAGDRSQSAPTRTVSALPRRGVLIWTEWLRRGNVPPEDRQYPRRSSPLRVQEADPSAAKGFSCPRTAQAGCVRRLLADSSGWDLTVWIFFGSGKPSSTEVATTNSELARLELD
jgi:hypothetical protein